MLCLMIALPFLHETPRYLYSRGLVEECKKSLVFFGHKDIDACIQEFEKEAKGQKSQLKWTELWHKVYIRRAIVLCSLVALAKSLCGMSFIRYFSTDILIGVGLSPRMAQYASVLIFVPSLASAFLGSYLIEKVGRRPLLISTTFILMLMNLALFAFSLVYDRYKLLWVGYLSVAACLIICLAFGLGPGILQSTVTPEMVAQNARSKTQLIVYTMHKCGVIVALFAFYPLQGLISNYVFVVYAAPLCLFLVVFILKFPETKNRSVLQIMVALGYVEGAEESNGKINDDNNNNEIV